VQIQNIVSKNQNTIKLKLERHYELHKYCYMATSKEISDSPDQESYRLLSVNAVKKILGVGYSTAKRWIESGIIESVLTDGKFRVPKCKLDKFISEGSPLLNNDGETKIHYEEDEASALSIISNLRKSSNGVTI